MKRYCEICKEEVNTSFIVNEGGISYARGVCGHDIPIFKQFKMTPTVIFKGSGWHSTDYKK